VVVVVVVLHLEGWDRLVCEEVGVVAQKGIDQAEEVLQGILQARLGQMERSLEEVGILAAVAGREGAFVVEEQVHDLVEVWGLGEVRHWAEVVLGLAWGRDL